MRLGIDIVLRQPLKVTAPDGFVNEQHFIRAEINEYATSSLEIMQQCYNTRYAIEDWKSKLNKAIDKILTHSGLTSHDMREIKFIEIPLDEYADYIINFNGDYTDIQKVKYELEEI